MGRKPGEGTKKRRKPRLPPPDRVVSENELTSPKGGRYRIVTSTETDTYDPPAPQVGQLDDEDH